MKNPAKMADVLDHVNVGHGDGSEFWIIMMLDIISQFSAMHDKIMSQNFLNMEIHLIMSVVR